MVVVLILLIFINSTQLIYVKQQCRMPSMVPIESQMYTKGMHNNDEVLSLTLLLYLQNLQKRVNKIMHDHLVCITIQSLQDVQMHSWPSHFRDLKRTHRTSLPCEFMHLFPNLKMKMKYGILIALYGHHFIRKALRIFHSPLFSNITIDEALCCC